MPSAISIDFVVGGIARVHEAFRTIEQSTLRAERQSVRSAQTTTRSREREYATLVKQASRWERESVKETERAERAKSKATEKEAKNRVQMMLKADKMQLSAQKEAAREFERIEAEKNAKAMQWVRKRERQELESARRTMRARESFARATVGSAGRGLSAGARSAASATMAVAGSMLSLGGGFSISDSVHRATAASGLAADISNSGYLPHGDVAANKQRRSSGEILGVTRGAASQFGLSNEDALGGLQKFTGLSGNLDQGMKLLPKLAEIARATGTSLDDLAEAAGNVSLNLGDTDKDGEQTLYVIRKLAEGGKLGAVEMRDFASQMSKVSAAAGKFAGNRAENMIKMGALAQEARGEGGAFSASVAANSVSGFTTTLQTGARVAEFQNHGIDVFADKGKTQFKAPEELIVESLRATKGNKLEMNKLFKNVMGGRAIEGFAGRYNAAGGGEAGEQAVRSRMSELIGKTSPKELETQYAADAQMRMQESDAKMATTMANFDKAVAEKLVPKLLELMPVIEKLIPQFVDLAARGIPAFVNMIRAIAEFADAHKGIIQSLAEHPIGSIIAFEVTKSLGSAMIGEAVKGTLLRLIAGGGTGGTPGGGGGGRGGAGALAVAAVALAAGDSTVDAAEKGIQGGEMTAQKTFHYLRKMREGVQEGSKSPAEAMRAYSGVTAMLDAAKERGSGAGNALSAGLSAVGTILPDKLGGGASKKEIADYNAANQLTSNYDDLAQSLKKLKDAADQAAAAQKNAPVADPNSSHRRDPLSFQRN